MAALNSTVSIILEMGPTDVADPDDFEAAEDESEGDDEVEAAEDSGPAGAGLSSFRTSDQNPSGLFLSFGKALAGAVIAFESRTDSPID